MKKEGKSYSYEQETRENISLPLKYIKEEQEKEAQKNYLKELYS